MELVMLLYAASIAENIRGSVGSFSLTFLLLGIVSAIVVVATSVSLTETAFMSDKFKTILRANRLARKCVTVLFFSWVGLCLAAHLVPSRRDVYVMAGGYVAMKVVNNEVVQDTANSVLGSIEKWLDKELAKEMESAQKAAQAQAGKELKKQTSGGR